MRDLIDIELMVFACLCMYVLLGPISVYGLIFLLSAGVVLQIIATTPGWPG